MTRHCFRRSRIKKTDISFGDDCRHIDAPIPTSESDSDQKMSIDVAMDKEYRMGASVSLKERTRSHGRECMSSGRGGAEVLGYARTCASGGQRLVE
jgi:hypothetical protein